MITFCLASGSWLGPEKNTVLTIIERIILSDQTAAATILIDNAAISRENGYSTGLNVDVLEIDLHNWVTEAVAEGGLLNVGAIRRTAANFPSGRGLVVINATGFMTEVIKKALFHVRIGMYSSAEWPLGISVVCDEAQQFQVVEAIAHTFYVRPALISDVQVDRYVRNMQRRGNILRYFGNRLSALVVRVEQRVNVKYEKYRKKVAKRDGWIWEEQ